MRTYFSRGRKDNFKRQKKRELVRTAIERERESIVPLLNMNSSNLRQSEGHDETKNIEVEGSVSPGNSNDGRISPASKISSDTEALTSDSVSDGLSIQDKKILLVAAEIDEMGMGRYQWYIWGLCGLGYFLDLLWAHAFGLIAPVLQREMGIDDTQLGRLFTVVNAGLTVGALVWGVLVDMIVFTFQESPKYLLSKGRDEEALKVLQKIAKTNKKPLKLTIEDFRALDNTEAPLSPTSTTSGDDRLRGTVIPKGLSLRQKTKREIKRVGILFKSKQTARVTILVWLIYAFDYWGFSVAEGAFLPTILARKGLEHKVGYAETYRNFVIIYMPGIVGVSLGALMVKVPRVGRRLSMIFSSALMATSFFLFAAVHTQSANVGLSVMEYFFQSMFNSVLYGWTPEAFPASVRGTASGMASFWGRLFSIFSPLIAAKLLATNLNGPLFLAGAGTFVACLGVALLPDNVMMGNEI
ncbi:hypothetical protein SS1G_06751 [Sclerotinia sclerotiorum 1980 UF-70]|uniref:Major facilitator superfamily (MFS) profile domain-containing protein n=1 Tax=Sclerotinia sclerotiorum (strain ATCC 18683 / 1980 / Ss-1) TaxID=665079 RepID=A7EN52_SCLS1|nr:hypothetical protein SS1G_06751 [Sclerotinia sclerotiorum 1980 UF-70]EDO04268.1 hypothetical protein SS1G_06751 [Sclerotinia sclerotiorum 1980 UF-70]